MKKLLRWLKYFLILILVIILIPIFIYFKWDIPVEELKEKYANETSEFIEVQGMQVHYRDEGEGDVIVLLHGTGASLHTWEPWTEILKKNYRVIRLDLPAYGLTGPHPEGKYQMDNYVAFLHEFLQKKAVQKICLGGNSFGGKVSWEYALKYPDEVEKLILIDASGYPSDKKSPWVFRLARTPVLNQIVRYVTPRFFLENNLKQVYADDSRVTDELITRYYDMALSEGNRQAFIDRAGIKSISNHEQIPSITAPTLILWGAEDLWIGPEEGEKFDANLPNSQLIIYENVGHIPMEEAPEKTILDVLEFLQAKTTAN